jgi:hypothetical protein
VPLGLLILPGLQDKMDLWAHQKRLMAAYSSGSSCPELAAANAFAGARPAAGAPVAGSAAGAFGVPQQAAPNQQQQHALPQQQPAILQVRLCAAPGFVVSPVNPVRVAQTGPPTDAQP